MSCECPSTVYVSIPGSAGAQGPVGPPSTVPGPPGLTVVGPMGPAGADGADGAAGANGTNAFTVTTADFVQPAVGGTVPVTVVSSAYMAQGQPVFMTTGGAYLVSGIPDATHVTLENLGYPGNTAPAVAVTAGKALVPSGLRGATGAAGSTILGTNYFRADKDGVNQVMIVGGDINVTFATERFDPGNVFAASSWTCPATGFYEFEVRLFWSGDTSTVTFGLYLNGAPGVGTVLINGTMTDDRGLLYSGVLSLTAGDVVQVFASQASGVAAIIQGLVPSTWISGMRIA